MPPNRLFVGAREMGRRIFGRPGWPADRDDGPKRSPRLSYDEALRELFADDLEALGRREPLVRREPGEEDVLRLRLERSRAEGAAMSKADRRDD